MQKKLRRGYRRRSPKGHTQDATAFTMNCKSSGVEIEESYPSYCPSGEVGGKWLLSQQYQLAPRTREITPMTTIFVSVQIQRKMNYDDQRSKLEDFNSRYKQLVKINLTCGKGTGA